MISISIIGSGNVAQHLISVIQKAENLLLVQAYSRNPNSLSHVLDDSKIISDYSQLREVDLYIIAVTDDVIGKVSSQIPFSEKLVVHTSGSVALDDLSSNNRKGVFYPLQTFTKNKEVDFKEIPICLEAEKIADLQLLKEVASAISDKVFEIDSEQRKSLHTAAVFVNNFVNHLYLIGNDICEEHNVPFEILKPLIKETANKIITLSPEQAQTGPAKRKDTTTINKHLAILTDANQKEIYKTLTKSIIDNGKL
jgi:predicted short-subunit dehydrogenase-like oxidoreductase (DUF2520 family)